MFPLQPILQQGGSAGLPGQFCVDANTAPFGSVDVTPRSRVCVRMRAPLGRVGRSGLPGAFWCTSPSPVACLGALFVSSAPSVLGLPCLWLLLCFLFFISSCAPPLFLAFPVLRPRVPWALASCGPPPPFPFPLPLPCFFLPAFLLIFFSASVLFSCRGVPVVQGWGGFCVSRCGVCWCVLLWVFCPGGGRSMFALCRSVLPGCARTLRVVDCHVARV